MILHEKYRPTRWEDVVGQDKAVTTIRRLSDRGIGGRAFWLSGQSGTGKTTIARLIALEIADESCVEELDASDATPSRLKEIEADLHYRGLGKGGRAVIVNEAHGLRQDAIRQLLVMLERLPDHTVMIFTTTCEAQANLFEAKEDASPLLSRCIEIGLSRRGLAQAFAERAREIAQAEGLDGQPTEKYVRLMQDCRNNLRQALQRIEAGEMIS